MLTPVHLSNMREFCHSLKQKGCFVHNIQLPDPLENKKVASQSRRNMFFRSVGTLIGTLTRSNLHGHAAAKVLTIKATDEPAPALSAIRASALLVDIAADTRNSQETNGASNGAMEQWSNGAMEQWRIQSKTWRKFSQVQSTASSAPAPAISVLDVSVLYEDMARGESWCKLEAWAVKCIDHNNTMATTFRHDKTPIICQLSNFQCILNDSLLSHAGVADCCFNLVSFVSSQSFKATSLAPFYLHHRCPALQKMFLVPSASHHPNNPPIHKNGLLLRQEMFDTCLACLQWDLGQCWFPSPWLAFHLGRPEPFSSETCCVCSLHQVLAPESKSNLKSSRSIYWDLTLFCPGNLKWWSPCAIGLSEDTCAKAVQKPTPDLPNFCICAASEWHSVQYGFLAALHLAVLNTLNMDTSWHLFIDEIILVLVSHRGAPVARNGPLSQTCS